MAKAIIGCNYAGLWATVFGLVLVPGGVGGAALAALFVEFLYL